MENPEDDMVDWIFEVLILLFLFSFLFSWIEAQLYLNSLGALFQETGVGKYPKI